MLSQLRSEAAPAALANTDDTVHCTNTRYVGYRKAEKHHAIAKLLQPMSFTFQSTRLNADKVFV